MSILAAGVVSRAGRTRLAFEATLPIGGRKSLSPLAPGSGDVCSGVPALASTSSTRQVSGSKGGFSGTWRKSSGKASCVGEDDEQVLGAVGFAVELEIDGPLAFIGNGPGDGLRVEILTGEVLQAHLFPGEEDLERGVPEPEAATSIFAVAMDRIWEWRSRRFRGVA